MLHRFLLTAAAGMMVFMQTLAQPEVQWQPGFIESLLESVESRNGESADYESLIHELENLYRNPIDLNKASQADLQKLPFLTDFQISSLLAYHNEHGKLLSIYELGLVYGFTDEVVRMTLPFVYVGEPETEDFRIQSALRRGHHEIVFRTQRILEQAAGYKISDTIAGTSRYPGNPWLYYARYGYESSNHIRGGITLEKDPGEDFFDNTNRQGFDFNSAYLMVNDIGPLKTALAGDYRLQFGQGLTLWNGSAPGKSALSLNIVKRQDAIKAFTSADENDLFRGVAASAEWGKFTMSLFCSSKQRDANITDTLPSGRILFSSFQESGYHRTPAEITDEKSVRETVFGGNLHYRNNWLKVGTTWAQYWLNRYWEKGEELKDVYDFEGTSLLNWGVDYTANLNRFQLFGETAHGNRGWATLNGVLYNVNKYASLSLLSRYFQTEFFSMHSSAFSEGSADNNEEAVYLGTIIHPFRKWQVSAYADFYHFPWLQYRVSAPSSGSDYLVQVDFTPGRKADMFFRLRYENDPANEVVAGQPLPILSSMKRTGLRYHISLSLSEQVTIQDRAELVWVRPDMASHDRGIMVYQDVSYRPVQIPLAVSFRFAWFDTDTYDSRIYAYEQDMTSGFTFSPLYSRGYRTYLMIRYDIGKFVSCRLRISQSNFLDKNAVGSGWDEIEGSTRTEVKLQVTARL